MGCIELRKLKSVLNSTLVQRQLSFEQLTLEISKEIFRLVNLLSDGAS